MLTAILVDDEPNVRLGVKMMIPWEELGIEVIAQGENGEDGLEKIIEYKPDIVITDVKMPAMSGIEMLEAAKNLGFSFKSMILSGYSDFAYAKEAMTLGVKRFILKPLDEDELLENLKDIRDEIISEKISEQRLIRGGELIVAQALKSLLLGNSEDFQDEEVSLFQYFSNFTVSIISVSQSELEEKKRCSFDDVLEELSKMKNIEVVPIDLNETVAVIFKDLQQDKIETALNKIYSKFGHSVYITIGSEVSSIYEISNSYFVADLLLKNKFLFMRQGIVTKDFITANDENIDMSVSAVTTKLFTFIEINDIIRLNETITEFSNMLNNIALSSEQIKVIAITVIRDIITLVTNSVGIKKIESPNSKNYVEEISTLASLYDIVKYFRVELESISNSVFGKTTKSNMERIVQYVNANYSKELRLELLANIFGYNSAYLGKVFHQYTGQNFNVYLDHIRIEKAKEMLAENKLKVYEVAESVGYTNINYFHNKFKKYENISPLTYKKNHIK